MHKILKDFLGSPDGIKVIAYSAGDITKLPESLASVAVKEGWAEVFQPQVAVEAIDITNLDSTEKKPKRAPKNKALRGAPENK
jgi:hypothetical protein